MEKGLKKETLGNRKMEIEIERKWEIRQRGVERKTKGLRRKVEEG
jgi:hypothetical protein